jgi:hypothetical protein
VREYAAEHGVGDAAKALELGMEEKAAEFVAAGGEVYLEDPARDMTSAPTAPRAAGAGNTSVRREGAAAP